MRGRGEFTGWPFDTGLRKLRIGSSEKLWDLPIPSNVRRTAEEPLSCELSMISDSRKILAAADMPPGWILTSKGCAANQGC